MNIIGQKYPKTDTVLSSKMACFWAYVWQPHDHIGWTTSMPFASINPTNPRNNPWNFHEKILRIGGVENISFFESAILNFFSKKKEIALCQENRQPVHMRYHFFLHYGWFLQNLQKEAVQTNMHTTVFESIYWVDKTHHWWSCLYVMLCRIIAKLNWDINWLTIERFNGSPHITQYINRKGKLLATL